MDILKEILESYLTIFKCRVSILRCKAAMYWAKRAQKCLDNHDLKGYIKYHEYSLRCMPGNIRNECLEHLKEILNN